MHHLGHFQSSLLHQITTDREIISSCLLEPHEHPFIELQTVNRSQLRALRWKSSFDSSLDCIPVAENALHGGSLNFDTLFLADLPGQLGLIRLFLRGIADLLLLQSKFVLLALMSLHCGLLSECEVILIYEIQCATHTIVE